MSKPVPESGHPIGERYDPTKLAKQAGETNRRTHRLFRRGKHRGDTDTLRRLRALATHLDWYRLVVETSGEVLAMLDETHQAIIDYTEDPKP